MLAFTESDQFTINYDADFASPVRLGVTIKTQDDREFRANEVEEAQIHARYLYLVDLMCDEYRIPRNNSSANERMIRALQKAVVDPGPAANLFHLIGELIAEGK